VDRANAVARAQAIPQDRELIHAIPQEYTVDKNQGVRDPVGMIGTRLETEMYLVTIGSSPAMNLRKAVERAGYKVGELVLEPLASALSVLTEDEKELGVALVEMGAGTTDVAVFHEGKIRHLGTVGYGGINVTSDIVHGLGVTQADAERLKEQYGAAYEPLVKHTGEQIKLPSTGGAGGPADPARAARAHHPPAHAGDLRDGPARHRGGGAHPAPRRRRGGDGRRLGAARHGGPRERCLRDRRAARRAGRVPRRAERQRAVAALQHGDGARCSTAPTAWRSVRARGRGGG
jgi:hypothetical protein